jgi:hypothetical protein
VAQSQGGQLWPGAQSAHAQAASFGATGSAVLLLDEPPGPPQLQSQGGQSAPGGHSGQAQVQVPSEQPPGSQLQSQGGQVSPGAHDGQAQVQTPPPPVALPPAQSQSQGGQSSPAGQYSGQTQAQSATGVWQKPPRSSLQPGIPAGHSASTCDQLHPPSARHASWLENWLQRSMATQLPSGQSEPAGQSSSSVTHWHLPDWPQLVASAWAWQPSLTR